MGLFDAYRLDLVETERLLGRPLRGDPSQGELAVLCSLQGGRLTEARQRLAGASIGADFHAHVTARLTAIERAPRVEVALPAETMEALRQRAAREGRRVEDVVCALVDARN